jgi:iron complex transport system ATP-binding protein
LTLELKNVDYGYRDYILLKDLSLNVREGEVLGILGPNGCGKTTLLKHLNKNLSPQGGHILLDGEDLETIAKRDIAKKVAVVPQTNEVHFSFTVRDIVSMGRMPFQGLMEGMSRSDDEIVDSALERVGLAGYGERHINVMSGGERQRVIIARALAQTPKILLMDEPTLHLDINSQFDVLDLVRDLCKQDGLTVVIVSHDLGMVARYCDRILMIHDHNILALGTPEEVLTPENMEAVFGVDAELVYDEKTKENTVFLHGSSKRLKKNEQ